MKKRNIKIREKFLICFILIGVLPLILVSTYNYVQTKNILLEKEENAIKVTIEQAGKTFDNAVSIYNNLSDYIAYNQTISQILSSEYKSSYERYDKYTNVLDPLLASLKYFHSDVKRVTIFTGEDTVEHDTTIAPITDIKNNKWYKEVVDNGKRNWIIDKDKEEAYCVQRMPFLNDNDKLGILYISVNYNVLFSMFNNLATENYGVIIKNTDSGKTLYSIGNFTDQYKKYKINDDELNKHFINDEYTIKNVSSIMDDVEITIYKPSAIVSDAIAKMEYISIIAGISCIIFSFVLSIILSRTMVSGIVDLSNNMNKVKNGSMEFIIKRKYNDEVGELITGFEAMLNQINVLIEQVYKKEIEKQGAEMKALQAQINPHFLYNYLSLVNWKALEAGQEDISKMSLALATFYRTALNKGQNEILLRDEIANVKAYLDIQLMMHDNSFDVEYNIDDSILDYKIINLILQPVVENAIEHGIDLKKEGKGKIQIQAKLVDNIIKINICDNGVGMDKDKTKTILTEQSKGYGISNVYKRLIIAYGEDYGISVFSKIDEGTSVIIKIPYDTKV